MPKPIPASPLFTTAPTRNRRVLIIPRFLTEAAESQFHHDGPEIEKAHAIIQKWAEKEARGQLKKKESALDANFLLDIFGHALRYTPFEHANTDGSFTLDRQLTIPNIGPVDGAIGLFPADKQNPKPIAVIELKGADTDLDTDKSNGRTAVQQLFDYLNGLPDTHWGILSNFSTIRLYRKGNSQAYEIFSLQKLAADLDHFKAFWCLLEKSGLIPSPLQKPRADQLLTQTGERQKEVGDELYKHYSDYRSALIATLRDDFKKNLDEAIRIAQKIFDRVIFVAFCEDRGLVNQKALERANREVPSFAKVKNPRWQNFVGLFHGIDKGHPSLGITHGYNGGLFAEDPAIDDLDLPDEPWTTALGRIGDYDFKDEVNVDVLGHIFERSITELEKLRTTGLFSKETVAQNNVTQKKVNQNNMAQPPSAVKPKMQKSAERKRFGIYYTPPEFTKFIVQQTVGELLEQRFANLENAHGITPDELAADYKNLSPRLEAYYLQCLQTLRNFKIVDPACGSGEFLIAAYEFLDGIYDDIIRHLQAQGYKEAPQLRDQIPDFILKDNLHGVDLSEEAVEITRLALWIRSARPGKTLADLTHNVLCGNSLVDDRNVHPKAMNWQVTFPQIFNTVVAQPPSAVNPLAPHGNAGLNAANPDISHRTEPGFDAVIGNPPWERLKLQEREFFAFSAPDIASAVSAAQRRKLIEKLEKKNPELHARYLAAQEAAEKTSEYARASNRFPLTAKGDINTYMLFAELARSLVAPTGRVGILVPSGIATDNTTKDFFADIIDTQALIKLYDFENKEGFFEDVHRAFKFCTLMLGGSATKTPNADFVFFAHAMEDLEEKNRHIPLSKKDIALLNPNTKTCPIFRTRRDADITKSIYKRIPILIDENRKAGGNPWAIRFVTMFHQTNDAELFVDPDDLRKKGYNESDNRFIKQKSVFLPLYEAKMVQAFDHRAASVMTTESNWVRQGQTDETSTVQHLNPEFFTTPRWWVDETAVQQRLGENTRNGFLCLKDVTSPTNQRTMIAAFIPWSGVLNSAPLMLTTNGINSRQGCCLLANLNSFPYDFVARQKVGGVHLNFFIVEQLPTLPPDTYAEKCPWAKKRGGETLEKWISDRVLKLTCTANDMIPLAKACNFNPKGTAANPPHLWKWKENERADLRAQLDAAYFHLYNLSRDDAIYILSTFQNTGDPDNPHSTTAHILEHYDAFAK